MKAQLTLLWLWILLRDTPPEQDDITSDHEEARSEDLDSGSYDVEDYWLYTFIRVQMKVLRDSTTFS